MNKTSFLSIVLVSTFLSCNAQRSQERTISAFNKLKISGAVNVVYTNSDTLNLTVKGKEKDLDNIETRVENSTLIISTNGKFNAPLYVYVKNNQLQAVESKGATNFKTTNDVVTDSIDISASGATDLNARLQAKKIKCVGDGASTIVLSGTTDNLNAEISSASTLKSYNLIARNAIVTTSGAASAKVHVTEKLNATASSASDIKVKGDPKDVTAETSTAANITRIKELSNTEKSNGDTTFYNWKSKKILIVNGSDDTDNSTTNKSSNDYNEGFKHWRGFSMGVNGYLSNTGDVNLPDKYEYMDVNYRRSLNFQFNIIERQINIVNNNFKLVTGFGFDYHLYELANKTTLNADSSFTWGVIDSTEQFFYKRNKLRCTYLQVPLLLEFNTSNDPEKAFHIAVGVVGQFLISSRTKQVLEDDKKNEMTQVRKDSYNMSSFAAKAHVNFGYKNWTFFGEYSLTPLFQNGKGPELYPFTAGIRVVPFS